MVFSSTIFLLLFLPGVLTLHLVAPRPLRNPLLLAASLLFYVWGEGAFLGVMMASVTIGYAGGLAIDWVESPRARRAALAGSVALALAILVVFKYAGFLASSWNSLAALAGFGAVAVPEVRLPLGVSFFTFHTISYLIDVSRGVVPAVRRLDEFTLYSTLFPHLVAGPVVRYREIADALRDRRADLAAIGDGCGRFVVGLAKKVLIADRVGEAADGIFALTPPELTAPLAWCGAVFYALQIYFDFSGYSDMAIGLGRMLGFTFPENFDRPYASASIREFWRRWHMTLSRWFRDYLFIPLGGSRGSALATARNLVIVFFLCGLWHGAAWTFVVWGLFHGFFLAAERFGEALVDWRPPRFVARTYTLTVVLVGWVFFRAESLTAARDFLLAMSGFGAANGATYALASFLSPSGAIAAVMGSAIVLAPERAWTIDLPFPRVLRAVTAVAVALLMLACFAEIVAVSSRPFLYFRF